jgi:hypothetical protein
MYTHPLFLQQLRASLFFLLLGFDTVRWPPVILSKYIQHTKGKRSRQENQAAQSAAVQRSRRTS